MRVQSWIDDYNREAKPCVDVKEFINTNGVTQNIWVDNVPIGIFVYTFCIDTISIHIVWIKPKYRNKIKEAMKYMAEWSIEEGYREVELIVDTRACPIVERYLKLKPVQKIYLTKIDRILEVL